MNVPRAAPNDEHYGPAPSKLSFERGTDGPRVIMVGVDGSPTSMHASSYACGLARRQGCRLVVLYVTPKVTFTSAVSPLIAAAQQQLFDDLTAELRSDIRRAAEELGVPTTFVTRSGDPYLELRDTADRVKADMLVVGASAQAGHRFVGSIATRLVRLGRWPVVVVP